VVAVAAAGDVAVDVEKRPPVPTWLHREVDTADRNREDQRMKYILALTYGTRAEQAALGMQNWRREDIDAHLGFLRSFNRELTESGELVAVDALAAPETTRIVRAGTNGKPVVTDGPFAEAKEFLAGFWIVDVDGPERAYALAARASAAPGPGGKSLNTPIEVRAVVAAP
jgi:hypothetical protein